MTEPEACDALELAVCEMKLDERAVVTCAKPPMFADEQLGLKDGRRRDCRPHAEG